MRVIKPGVFPVDPKYVEKCRKCTCVFEFSESDTKSYQYGSCAKPMTIRCPQCFSLMRYQEPEESKENAVQRYS